MRGLGVRISLKQSFAIIILKGWDQNILFKYKIWLWWRGGLDIEKCPIIYVIDL